MYLPWDCRKIYDFGDMCKSAWQERIERREPESKKMVTGVGTGACMGILSCVCYVRYWGNRACFVLESFGKKLRSENWRLSLCVENQPKGCYKVNGNSAVLKKYQIFYNMVHIIIKKLEGNSNIKIIGGR